LNSHVRCQAGRPSWGALEWPIALAEAGGQPGARPLAGWRLAGRALEAESLITRANTKIAADLGGRLAAAARSHRRPPTRRRAAGLKIRPKRDAASGRHCVYMAAAVARARRGPQSGPAHMYAPLERNDLR
jgi:hypothetical protein